MKILLVIDHFGSGGAQRQMVYLAGGLHDRGHDVEFFVYHPHHDFFRSAVDERRIVVHEVDRRSTSRLGVSRPRSLWVRLRFVFPVGHPFPLVVSQYFNLAALTVGPS